MNLLCCPNCGKPLEKTEKQYVCPDGHRFDRARSGYVNLLIRHSASPGDSDESLASRDAFLSKGYYRALRDGLARAVREYVPHGSFLDAGCGTGYYLEGLSDRSDLDLYATDIARKGVMMTARKNPQATCFVGNVFHLPFADGTLDGLMSVFTPYGAQEFLRVVKPGGAVIAVTPAARHLYELKEIVYDEPYLNSEKGYDLPGFELLSQQVISDHIVLDSNEDIRSLWQMMPYYHTTSRENNERLLKRDQAETEIAFLLQVFDRLI